jgi:hypothetical protein
MMIRFARKLQVMSQYQIILAAPFWPQRPWFPTGGGKPLKIPLTPNFLSQRLKNGKWVALLNPDYLKFPRLFSIQDSVVVLGFSEEVAAQITGNTRKSTNEIYDMRWSVFAEWYNDLKPKNRPHKVSLNQGGGFSKLFI